MNLGEKIKMLVDEGKSKDQAVAIALSMQKRGKLKSDSKNDVASMALQKMKK